MLDSPFSSGEPILCVWGRGLGRPHQAAQQVKTKPLHTWAREARVEGVEGGGGRWGCIWIQIGFLSIGSVFFKIFKIKYVCLDMVLTDLGRGWEFG